MGQILTFDFSTPSPDLDPGPWRSQPLPSTEVCWFAGWLLWNEPTSQRANLRRANEPARQRPPEELAALGQASRRGFLIVPQKSYLRNSRSKVLGPRRSARWPFPGGGALRLARTSGSLRNTRPPILGYSDPGRHWTPQRVSPHLCGRSRFSVAVQAQLGQGVRRQQPFQQSVQLLQRHDPLDLLRYAARQVAELDPQELQRCP
jgi:hypothetical protein